MKKTMIMLYAVGAMLPMAAKASSYWYKNTDSRCWDGKVWYYGANSLTGLSYTQLGSHLLEVNQSTEAEPLRVTNGIAAVASDLRIGTSEGRSPVVQVEAGGSIAATYLYVGYGNSASGRLVVEGGELDVSDSCYIGGASGVGFGEIVLSNATFTLSNAALGHRLHLGSYAGSWGVLRGWGAVSAGANNAYIDISRGQIVADGFGEERTLDFGSLASAYFTGDWSADGTNGWYAVRKGKVQMPRRWLRVNNKDSDELVGCCSDYDNDGNPTNLVNSVGFRLGGFGSAGTRYFRCAIYADDRTDVHLDSLPENDGVVGVWSMRFDDGSTYCAVNSVSLAMHFDPAKAKVGNLLALYRWNGSAWDKIAEGTAAESRVFSVSGLKSVSQSENIGTFALVKRLRGFVISFH